MIRGSFDRASPVVECRLVIPRLSVNHRLMLLVGTGASASCLHPADAIRTGIPFDELGNRVGYAGIGGSSAYFRESANLLFEESSYLQIYRLDLQIAASAGSNRELPSLLGRDVLNRRRMDYDSADGRLECTVRSADHTSDRLKSDGKRACPSWQQNLIERSRR